MTSEINANLTVVTISNDTLENELKDDEKNELINSEMISSLCSDEVVPNNNNDNSSGDVEVNSENNGACPGEFIPVTNTNIDVTSEVEITELDLDKTTMANEEGLKLLKMRPIDTDLSDNLFIKTEFTPTTKRKGKMKLLLEESIAPDVYQKKCGFITTRPLSWAKALEVLLEHESDTVARWYYKQEHGLFNECQIDIYFETVKRVTVDIFIKWCCNVSWKPLQRVGKPCL